MELYELAKEEFIATVLDDPNDLELYNESAIGSRIDNEADEIIGIMCHEAEVAMRECAKEYKRRFMAVLDGERSEE